MIYDKLSEIARYRGLSENLDMGIRFLQSTDLFSLPMGRTEILGSSQSSLMEAHERYLDIHIVLSGLEQVMVAPIETLTEVEIRADEDSIMYRGAPEYTFTLEPGRFLLVYPGEGHLPKLAPKAPEDVDKLVLKIAF